VHSAWTKIERIYESKGPVRKTTLYKQLYKMKKDSETSMTKYLNDFMFMPRQLTEAGINIRDDLLLIMLLGSLPEEFESFTVAIKSRDEIPSVNNLERDGSEKEKKNDADNEALYTKASKQISSRAKRNKYNTKQQPKFNGKCYECEKIGHKSTVILKKNEKKNKLCNDRNCI